MMANIISTEKRTVGGASLVTRPTASAMPTVGGQDSEGQTPIKELHQKHENKPPHTGTGEFRL